MKKFLTFIVVLFVFVVGALGSQQTIKVPKYLPIGTAFPPENTKMRIGIMYEDPTNSADGFATNVMYSKEMGTLEEAVKRELAKLVELYVPDPGTETLNRMIDVAIEHYVPETELEGYTKWFPIGGSYLMSNVSKLVQVNGRWTFSQKALDLKISYQSYLGIYAGGLSEVERFQWTDEVAGLYYREFSPNGISDVTCSQYPGGVAYDGPDMLQMPIGFAYPEYYAREYPGYIQPSGYYKLYFGLNKSVWAKYDLETGRMLDTNLPKPVTLRLNIELVNLESVKLTGLSSRKSALGKGIKLSVVGSPGQSGVIEYSDTIGVWQKLVDVSLVYGSTEYVDELVPSAPARFYRVK